MLYATSLVAAFLLFTQKAAAKCYIFDENGYGNSSSYQINENDFGICGSGEYVSCCQIGDTCVEGGLCQLYGYSSETSYNTYYLAGCTDSSGQNSSACAGYCPKGYPYLQWNENEIEWLCCPTYYTYAYNSGGNCVAPKAPYNNDTEYVWRFYDPEDLLTTAVVEGFSSFSPLTSTLAGFSFPSETSYAYPTTTGYGYYSTATSYSSGDNPYYDDEGVYSSPILLAVVIVVPVLVGSFIIGLLIWLCVHKHNKHMRLAAAAAPASTGQGGGPVPAPNGVVFPSTVANQFALAGPAPGQTQAEYDNKMAAMGWLARQPPQAPTATSDNTSSATTSQMTEVPPNQGNGVLAAPARSAPSPPPAANGTSSRSTALLPPITEVSHFDGRDMAQISSGDQTAERGLPETNGETGSTSVPAVAAEPGGPSEQSPEPQQQTHEESSGGNWPLGTSAAAAATAGQEEAAPTDTGAGPRGSSDARHHDAFYA